jgi:membrane protein implicated in regulation of membrane protease activity
MHFSRPRMVGLRLVYFVLAVAILTVAKVEFGFSLDLLYFLIVSALITIIISYPIQMRMIRSVAFKKRVLGPQAMIGLDGIVVERISPAGRVKVRGEIWKARTSGQSLERGEEIVIKGVENGLTLLVDSTGSANNRARETSKNDL